MPTSTEVFTVDADIHEAGHNCNGTVLEVPYGHGSLPQQLVRSCGLDTPTLVIQSDERDLRYLLLTVWLDGPREEQLEVGSIYFWDHYLRAEESRFVPFLTVSGPHWPMASAKVELSESFDLTPHAGRLTAPPLIIQVRSTPLMR